MMRYLVLAVLLFPDAVSADCAAIGLSAKVLNPDATIIVDGGLVVAAVPEHHGPMSKGDAAIETGWKLRDGSKPVVKSLAPGLALYRVAPGDELVDAAKKVVARVKGSAKLDAVPAPKVKAIKYEHQLGRRSMSRVTVDLVGAAPDRAIAIILGDAKGTPRSWGLVEAGKPIYAFLSRDCLTLPNGTVPSKDGDMVKLWFVDDAGRPSAMTAAIKIAKAPTTTP